MKIKNKTMKFKAETIKLILTAILTSSITASGISMYMQKNSELETRTYELKYEVYSNLNESLADLDDAISFKEDENLKEITREIKKQIPNILLVTQNNQLVRSINTLQNDLLEKWEIDELDKIQRKKIIWNIMRITISMSDDFSNFVTTEDEVSDIINSREILKNIKANLFDVSSKVKR